MTGIWKRARGGRERLRIRRPARMLATIVIGSATVLTAGSATGLTAGAAARLTGGAAAPAAGTKPSGSAPVGRAPMLPAGARVLGPVPRSIRLHVTLALRSRDPGGMAKLAQQVATPSSGRYRLFLTPRQVRARFGSPRAAVSVIRSWLRGYGLTVSPTSGDGLLLPATGSVAEIEQAFATPIQLVRLPGGRLAYANSRPASVPARTRPWVVAVLGLDNLVLPQIYLAQSAAARRQATDPATGPSTSVPTSAGPHACHAARATPATFTAEEIAHAYEFDGLYRRGILGQGVTVALLELANYANGDITTYTRYYRIRSVIRRVRVDGGTTIRASGHAIVEATADIETVAGLAPRASILVYEAPGAGSFAAILDDYAAILQQDRAQVVSSSYGYCEQLLAAAGRRNFVNAEAGIFADMAIQAGQPA